VPWGRVLQLDLAVARGRILQLGLAWVLALALLASALRVLAQVPALAFAFRALAPAPVSTLLSALRVLAQVPALASALRVLAQVPVSALVSALRLLALRLLARVVRL
jgi:hypothetical protein